MNNNNEGITKSFRKLNLKDFEINSYLSDIAKLRAEEKVFSNHFSKNWSEAFTASECFYVMICRSTKLYSDYIKKLSEDTKSEKISTLTALSNIHTRASQQYLEILTLIKNGFPDGAFARWRSMYELSVIASFITKYGEDTAEKFIEASQSQDRYDWAMASNAFPENKRHITFGDILKLCDMDFDAWKDDYTAANQTVHASPQGTFGRLGAPDGVENNSKRSAYGIAAPAIQSANTLALISSMLFSIFPDDKTIESMSTVTDWLNELIDLYCETHDKLFHEE